MQKYNSLPAKATAAPKFSVPKLPQGRPVSGGQAARNSASAYGKLSKMGGGKTAVKMQKAPSQ